MKLLFKQRVFSWFDSYDIYGEDGETVFTVQGRLSWGHCLEIFGPGGENVGTCLLYTSPSPRDCS